MELLDLLEQGVGALLEEVAALREETRRLRADVEAGQHNVEEIRALREELAREKQVREQALARVDMLLHRIQAAIPTAGDSAQPEEANRQAPSLLDSVAGWGGDRPEADQPHPH